ncbi:MAG: TlpA family protein disulfide reductase [Actinobacteria bacterium]|nr:TlpA family protein disulfide reductase [Actinomycetota bacterium]
MARRTRILLQAAAVAVVASLVVLLAVEVFSDSKGRNLVSAVRRGETPPAPSLELPALEGDKRISLASYRGKAVVLNFWASWCEPCKKETPMLQEAYERYRGEGLVVLGVNAQDFRTDARRFAERYEVTYPLVHDGPGATREAWGLTGFPETWWIDRQGRLVAYVQGQFSARELERNIERALGPA